MAIKTELYSRYAHWLRRVLSRRFGVSRADDLVQETYLRLASGQAGERIRQPRAYLMSVASNVARDQGRRQMARGGANAVSFDDLYEGAEPSVGSDQLETLLLKQVILALPELYRDVFVLSRFGGLTYEEIASHCGLSVKTVEWRMSKALALCAAQLAK